ncbi:DUF7527 domain-containing protein [Halopiger djelfimassiliensis]|uniref:DUF7527 domain-containing protein n=1 Tax=Halopiger djelfimassiliensis TaxID=1293047 RepID=UPI00067765DC|nr:transcriptional regulator [Halopiger djelfimassiliensis]
MDPRTQERVEQWDSRPFSGGYDGLSDLADSGFSGAVAGGGSWLFMLNGRVVGVFDGEIEDFESASGTVYQAPHPSLPLLCTMEERGGETRAKYYTNETPLREVDQTLQSGSFTGYIELSENVLSGDYYAVYYGGRRMAAAYIGNAERLLTGEEAFERAADEVGIYEVVDVEIDVTDVPGADESDARSTAGTDSASTDSAGDSASTEPAPESTGSGVEPIDISSGSQPVSSEEPEDSSSITTATGVTSEPEPTESITRDPSDPSSDQSTADTEVSEPSVDIPEPTETAAGATDEPHTTGTEADPDSTVTSSSSPDPAEVEAAAEELDRKDISWVEGEDEPETEAARATKSAEADAERGGDPTESAAVDGTQGGSDEQLEEQFEEEEQWRETRSIPSIDPDKTDATGSETAAGTESDQRAGTRRAAGSGSGTGSRTIESGTTASEARATGAASNARQQRSSSSRAESGTGSDAGRAGNRNQQTAALTQRIERLEEKRDALATKVEELESEREQLRAENQELSSTVERLRARIEELETELERARDGAGPQGPSGGTELSPAEALSGTNLFVRYDSKSQPTLETAHDGNADREEVASNLRLEHHTGFDAADVVVDGQSYEEFLTSSMEYRFVDWLTEMVLYEIRDTGHADGLADLYDAIPRIDRAELQATISLEDDDTDDVPDEVTFDVVAFDKMGNPLVLATLNDSREPATQTTLEELEEAASAVKANHPDLAAAIAVTSSYFEPGALEVTEAATSSGFLSRGSKLSYVNLSRKRGYHLCLVESRSEGFHMNVPEL